MGVLGLVLAMLFFVIYAAGLFPASVSPAESAAMWDRPSAELQESGGVRFETFWFIRITDSYILSSGALAVLASTALPTLLALALGWFRRRDWLYGSMSLIISAVILVAIAI